MPYELRNAAQNFQKFMNYVFRGLSFSWAYLDDLLMASSSPELLKQHVLPVFSRMQQFGIKVNIDKVSKRLSPSPF